MAKWAPALIDSERIDQEQLPQSKRDPESTMAGPGLINVKIRQTNNQGTRIDQNCGGRAIELFPFVRCAPTRSGSRSPIVIVIVDFRFCCWNEF